MASVFGHALSGYAICRLVKAKSTLRLILICVACTVIPDLDVIAFKIGIPYESMFGHRGFSHSIVFALLFALLMKFSFYRKVPLISLKGAGLVSLFFICTISHGLLDAMTTGGRGVGFFIPFDNSRYFFPFRPIKVSPIGAAKFFSEWGWQVLKSEFIWIGIPSLILIMIRLLLNKFSKEKTPVSE